MATDTTMEPTRSTGGSLKLVDVIAQSVGFMGPVFSSSIVVTVLIAGASGRSAGGAAPLSVLLAAIGVLALSWIVAQYARRIHAAGSLYNYVAHGLGVRVGAAAGILYYAGILMLGAAIAVLLGGNIHDTLDAEFHHPIMPIWAWQLILVALIAAIAYLGVQLSVKAQLVLALVSAVVLLIFFITVIAKVGSDNDVAKAFTPSTSPAGMSGVLFGVIYAVLLFTGFETAANLAEETARPKRDIPRAILWSVGIAAVFFLIASYAQVAGFGFDADKMLKAVESGVPPLIVLGGPGSAGGYGSVFVRRLLEFIVIMDMLAVYIGCAVAASRGTFALARDRWLPKPLTSVSRSRGTPFGATVLVIAVYLVWILLQHVAPNLFEMPETPSYFSYYFWLSGFGIFALLVVYLLVCVGAPRGLRDHGTPATVWLCALLGTVLAVGAIFGAFYKVTSPLVWTGWSALILFAIALAVCFVVGQGRTLADLHSGEENDSIVAVREHPIYHAES